MDLCAFFDLDCELKSYASFTYLTEYTDEENDIDLFYTPQWTTSYGIQFTHPGTGFFSKLNFSYIGEQDITDYEGTGETTLDGYTTADLTISKDLYSFVKYGCITLRADITNLFNEDYAVVQGYPSPGRSFFIGLKYVY